MKPGIQLLKPREVLALGPLNDRERRTLRPVVNTKDVYPYATVLPSEPDHVVYLAKPDDITRDTRAEEAVHWEFPDGLPHLREHLERYRPVLEHATAQRGEKRPWWTLHRPRADVLGPGAAGKWDPYCLTTRWGSGNRLVVGLAPARSSPASGLHLMRPTASDIGAPYLAALYNSSVYQEIVDSLPPGNLRGADLMNMGAPWLPDIADELQTDALEIANLVVQLVSEDAARFPRIPEALRSNVGLTDVPTEAWAPREGLLTTHGRRADVAWTTRVEVLRAPRQAIGAVSVSETLLGRLVEVSVKGSRAPQARIELADRAPAEAARSLAAVLRAAAERQLTAVELPSIIVPVDPNSFVKAFDDDRTALMTRVEAYRDRRSAIDAALLTALYKPRVYTSLRAGGRPSVGLGESDSVRGLAGPSCARADPSAGRCSSGSRCTPSARA